MNQKNFTEEDKKNVVDFLNLVAKKAKFKVDTNEIINYFKLLSFMQQTLLPKINDHIFQIERVVEPPKEEDKSKKTKSRKKE